MPHDREDNDRISGSAKIATLLRRLQEERTLLTASIAATPGMLFNTVVLAVDTARGQLILDEFNDERSRVLVQPGTHLHLDGRLQGIDTHFQVEVADIGSDGDDIRFHRAAFPEYIVYRQRRRYYRVPVRLTRETAVNLTTGEERTVVGRLSDLSVSGLGGIVVRGEPPRVGERYICTLQLPGQPALMFRIEIRFVQHDDDHRAQRFGAMIYDISLSAQRRLERVVMELERELRRST